MWCQIQLWDFLSQMFQLLNNDKQKLDSFYFITFFPATNQILKNWGEWNILFFPNILNYSKFDD